MIVESIGSNSYNSIVFKGYVLHWLGFQFEGFIVLLYLILDWKRLETIHFVLIRIRIGAGYKLQLAFGW
jgi:hypothetical protein